jgi:hypothetical protein
MGPLFYLPKQAENQKARALMDKVHVGGLPGTQGKVKKGGEQRWRHK